MTSEPVMDEIDDRSLVQPWLAAHVWEPLMRRLPRSLSPNSISVFGLTHMLGSGVFTWLGIQHGRWWYLGTLWCIAVYLTCDNIDGIFARAHGKTSRLGEFFDHWFDTFANGVLSVSIGLAFGLHGWLFLAYLGALSLVQFSIYWEQLHTGKMIFGRLGSNESVLMIMALFVLLTVFYGQRWISYEEGVVSFPMLVALFTCGNSLHTLIFIYRRTRVRMTDLIPPALTVACVALAFGLGRIDYLWAGLAIMIGNVLASGGLLIERLAGRSFFRRSLRQAALCAVLLLHVLLGPAIEAATGTAILLWVLAGLAALGIGWDLVRALTRLDGPHSKPAAAG
jgi:phosphatidylglycerophosphate synthase